MTEGNDLNMDARKVLGEIDLGDIPEHGIGGRIRQGYIAEWNGDKATTKAIYNSIGFKERKL